MDFLDRILASKRKELELAQLLRPRSELERLAAEAPPTRDFFSALDRPGGVQLIAEIKKASPSRGVIRADFDPVQIAKIYQRHGAACISVLTDESHFQGSLDHLKSVRGAVDLPLLRKDFVIDSYQVLEARAAGADAVLLIAECLDDCRLRALVRESLDSGLTPLVELFEPENLPRAIDAGATLIGVNNRNLRTFEMDFDRALRMAERVPHDCLLVAESGIRTRGDVERLAAAGIRAMLVGETLMSRPDVGRAVDELLGNA